MTSQFDTIRHGLERLRKSAKQLKVFGADGHGFRVNPPLSEIAIQDFEAQHQCSLPAEYRDFLLHVGNGGAGPYYGLFKLGEMDDSSGHAPYQANGGFVGKLSDPFPHTAPWNDLTEIPSHDELNDDDAAEEDEYQERLNEWETRVYWNPAVVAGAVPICHLGCALRQWLVVTGPEAGNVWNDHRVDEGGLSPVRSQGKERVGFLDWYGTWLDDALRQLPS